MLGTAPFNKSTVVITNYRSLVKQSTYSIQYVRYLITHAVPLHLYHKIWHSSYQYPYVNVWFIYFFTLTVHCTINTRSSSDVGADLDILQGYSTVRFSPETNKLTLELTLELCTSVLTPPLPFK